MKIKNYSEWPDNLTGALEFCDGFNTLRNPFQSVNRNLQIGNIRHLNNGILDREDGPAIIWYNGENQWALDGIVYPKEIWEEKIKKNRKNV